MLYDKLLGSRVTLSLTLTWKAFAIKAFVILKALERAVRYIPNADHSKVIKGWRNVLL